MRAGWRLLEAERSKKSRGERNEDLELRVPRLKERNKNKNKNKKQKKTPKSVLAEMSISPGIGRNAPKHPK
jgi:hypothetical protein